MPQRPGCRPARATASAASLPGLRWPNAELRCARLGRVVRVPVGCRASPAATGSADASPRLGEDVARRRTGCSAFGLAADATAPEPGLAYSRPAGSGAAVRNTWEGGHASLTPAAAGHAIRATHARPGRTTPLTCRRGTSGLHIRESRHAPAVRGSGWILLKGPGSPGPRSLRHAIPQSDGRIVRGRGPARKDAVPLRPRPGRHPPAVPQPAGQARPLPPGDPAVPPGPAGRVRVRPHLVLARRHLPRT